MAERDEALAAFFGDPDRTEPLPEIGVERTLGQTFSDGVSAGAAGLGSSVEYFSALANTLVGDEQGAAEAVGRAQGYEEDAANAVRNIGTFSDFAENPTFGGFAEQTAKATGQMVPFAIESIAGALFGAGSGLALSKASQLAAKKIIKEAVEDTQKGVANDARKEIAMAASQVAKRGALAGAATAEFVPLAGENLGAGLEAGAELDRGLALRSLGVAGLQTPIGVGSEAALLSLVAKQAKRQSVEGKDGIMSRLAKEAGKGFAKQGAIEGTSELAQETISTANQTDLGVEFTKEDLQLKAAESLFAGFMGGGVMGAGTAGLSSAAKTIGGSTADTISGVGEKMRRLVDDVQQGRVDETIAQETVGDVADGQTSQESPEELNAQFDNMLNPTARGADSMWESTTRAPNNMRPNEVVPEMSVNKAGDSIPIYKAFIPGRGVVSSLYYDKAQAVVDAGASDESLAPLLGFSGPKQSGADLVVQALDAKGRVVREELTTADNVPAAQIAMQKMVPEGGKLNQPIPVEEALARRASQVEQDPTIRAMDIDDETLKELTGDSSAESFFERMASEAAMQTKEGDSAAMTTASEAVDQNIAMFTPKDVETYSYVAKKDPNKIFDNTESTRAKYAAIKGAVDWNDPFYAGMSEALLNKVVSLEENNPSLDVDVTVEDGKYTVTTRTTPDTELYNLNDQGVTERLTLEPFMAKSVKIAARVARAEKTVTKPIRLTTPEGKEVVVQERDIANMGRRLLEGRGDGAFAGSAKEGLIEALKQLSDSGYGVSADRRLVSGTRNPRFTRTAMTVREARERTADGSRGKLLGMVTEQSTDEQVKEFRNAYENKDGIEITEGINWVDKGNIKNPNVRERLKEAAEIQRQEAQQSEYGVTLEEKSELNRANIADLQTNVEGVVAEAGADSEAAAEAVAAFEAAVDRQDDLDRAEFEKSSTDPNEMGRQTQLSDDPNLAPDNLLNDNVQPAHRTMYSTAKPRNKRARTAPVGLTFPAGDIGLAGRVLVKASKALRLKHPVSVLGTKELNKLTDKQLEAMFKNEQGPSIVPHIKEQLTQLNQGAEKLGRYIGFENAHIIIVDNQSAVNDAQVTMVAAHELGHALFQEEKETVLGMTDVNRRLIKAFREAQTAEGAPEAYNRKHGFEEWYADQVAIRVRELTVKAGEAKKNKPLNRVQAYFNDIAKRLRDMWRALVSAHPSFKKRFGKQDQTFEKYIAGVEQASRFTREALSSAARAATFEQKLIVRSIADEVSKQQSDSRQTLTRWASAFGRAVKRASDSDSFASVSKLLLTADNVLRKASPELADIFYTRSNDKNAKGDVGFIRATDSKRQLFQSELNRILGEDWSVATVSAALAQAQSDIPTDSPQMMPLAKEVRLFLERMHSNYIAGSNTEIGKQDNYFVRALDLQAITDDPQKLIDLLVANEPNIYEMNERDRVKVEERVEAAVKRLVSLQHSILDDNPVEIDSTEPTSGVTEALKLTRALTRDQLVEAGLLLPPDVSLIQYIRHIVKRVEYDRRVPPVKPGEVDRVTQILQGLPSDKRATAKAIIHAYLGYNIRPLEPFWRKVNSYAQFIQFITILPFATLGSLPDFGGPLINSKEFSAFGTWTKEFKQQFANKEEARKFGEMVGVVAGEAQAHTWMSVADADYMDPKVRKWSSNFFRATFLEQLTTFSRHFAAGMGAEFLSTHARGASPRSARYLEALGVTREDVLAWESSGATRTARSFEGEAGQRVQSAILKFVTDSVLKPNAAERPLWASDPKFAIVWQLKSFMYSFGKVIVGGTYREIQTRMGEADNNFLSQASAVTLPLALAAVALLPLAALGLELREYAKTGLSYITPGVEGSTRYMRTDDMEWGEYFSELVDRTGVYGPLAIVGMMQQNAEWDKNPLLPLLGPTVEMTSEVLSKGWDGATRLQGNRLLPLYNQL